MIFSPFLPKWQDWSSFPESRDKKSKTGGDGCARAIGRLSRGKNPFPRKRGKGQGEKRPGHSCGDPLQKTLNPIRRAKTLMMMPLQMSVMVV